LIPFHSSQGNQLPIVQVNLELQYQLYG